MKALLILAVWLPLAFNGLSISGALAATCPIKPIGVSYSGTASKQIIYSTAVVELNGQSDANDRGLIREGVIAAKTNLIRKNLLSDNASGELQGVLEQGTCRVSNKLYVTVMLDEKYAGVASKAKSDIRRSLETTSSFGLGSPSSIQQPSDSSVSFESLMGSPPEVK